MAIITPAVGAEKADLQANVTLMLSKLDAILVFTGSFNAAQATSAIQDLATISKRTLKRVAQLS